MSLENVRTPKGHESKDNVPFNLVDVSRGLDAPIVVAARDVPKQLPADGRDAPLTEGEKAAAQSIAKDVRAYVKAADAANRISETHGSSKEQDDAKTALRDARESVSFGFWDIGIGGLSRLLPAINADPAMKMEGDKLTLRYNHDGQNPNYAIYVERNAAGRPRGYGLGRFSPAPLRSDDGAR
jgi:hypothetical protein